MDYPFARIAVLAALSLTGCAVKHVQVRQEIVIRRACMDSIELTPQAECRRPEGGTEQHCTGIKIVEFKGCEEVEVVKSKEKK